MSTDERHRVVLFDRSIADWRSDSGLELASPTELRSALLEFAKGDPRIFDLRSPEGSILQLGLGGAFSFAQFLDARSDRAGPPPSFVARAAQQRGSHEVEFSIATTPTPISPEYCLSLEEALRVAEYFFLKGERDPSARWDKVC